MEPTVWVRDLHMRFGRTDALAGVSLDLAQGVTGLLGPNGAGKSTLLRVLATVLAPQQGAIRVLGLDPRLATARLAIRSRLGYMPQEPGFYSNFTTFEFVDYVAILKELVNRKARRDEVHHVLELVGLSSERHKKIKALSGGMRRRVALAQALLGCPELLILDEPTSGLDPEQRLRFRELIGQLGEGCRVLLSTHQTEDVSALCKQVVVLHRGTTRFQGTPKELTELALGRVWHSPTRAEDALASLRTGTGMYRNVGTPPAETAQIIDPTLEDGYLLLLGRDAAVGKEVWT